ncbi:MAG: hypothetical protein Q4D22_01000 [Candidatus Saccharibacteria bacterium]|nr:hypothetical protein [Candidatus Saccharibacteria bacterium]
MKKRAFTIIEFTLAMALLSTMLLMIALLTVRISGIYQKGLSIRAVNSVGREIIDDIKKTVQSSPIQRELNPDKPTGTEHNITLQSIIAKRYDYFVTVAATENSQMQGSGFFCTGSYTYIWNTAQTLNGNTGDGITITVDGGEPKLYKFVRIPDAKRLYCENNSGVPSYRNIEIADEDMIVSLINDDESDLAIYDFTVLPATQSNTTGHAMYPISFILATRKGGINILGNGDFCTGKPRPTALETSNNEYNTTDFNYCAVNKFDVVIRQAGESEDVNGYGSR